MFFFLSFFNSKGEIAIHSEISFFVYKHDLKQSQISRMAGWLNFVVVN
jgi:hypothetical protein